ncbi:MAG: hypothetical protein ABS955_04090, partial [Stenotrophomonas maltophilia]
GVTIWASLTEREPVTTSPNSTPREVSTTTKSPGLGQIPEHLKQQVSQGKEVPRMIAIINSMTKKERRNPGLLNGSRRARIARGSGLTPADVNKLMKQFQQMEKMMSKMAGGGMKGMMRSMKGMMGAMGGRGGMPFR